MDRKKQYERLEKESKTQLVMENKYPKQQYLEKPSRILTYLVLMEAVFLGFFEAAECGEKFKITRGSSTKKKTVGPELIWLMTLSFRLKICTYIIRKH